jgi:hypothetical protein
MKHSFLEKAIPPSTHAPIFSKSKKYSAQLKNLFQKHPLCKLLVHHELETWGIPLLVDGLEHHYRNHSRLEKRQEPGNALKFSETIHEITAYFNRLGQIHALITSNWIADCISEKDIAALCPSILSIIPFRDKQSAHRSFDRPLDPSKTKRTETDSQRESHSDLLLFFKWTGKVGNPELHLTYELKIAKDNRSKLLTTYHHLPVSDLEHFTNDEISISFTPNRHHNQIMREILKIFEKAVQNHP